MSRPGRFPEILHTLIEHSEENGYSSIISWLPHGRAFKIHNTALFVERVMPKYFSQTKISSFRRQMQLYGFWKLKKILDKDTYFHELFVRGRSDMCKEIKREQSRRAILLKEEPNFCEMPPLKPSVLSFNKTQASVSRGNNKHRTIRYMNTQNGTESGEVVNLTSLEQFDPVLASLSAILRPRSVSASATEVHHKHPTKFSKNKPTPIRILCNGTPLTKNEIKSGGYCMAPSLSDRPTDPIEVPMNRRTPIICNGTPLTKTEIKSGGYRMAPSLSDRPTDPIKIPMNRPTPIICNRTPLTKTEIKSSGCRMAFSLSERPTEPIKMPMNRPTPIKIICKGKPLTKNEIKSSGFSEPMQFLDKDREMAQVLFSLKQQL